MLKVSRLTDYAIVVLAALHRRAGHTASVSQLAGDTGLNEPTLAKVLRPLAQAGLVDSRRGVHGGYSLARPALEISVAQVITAMEGPIAITACVDGSREECQIGHRCAMAAPWNRVNRTIQQALERLSLAEMAGEPAFALSLPDPRPAEPVA